MRIQEAQLHTDPEHCLRYLQDFFQNLCNSRTLWIYGTGSGISFRIVYIIWCFDGMDANIISQLMFAFTRRNRSISMESLWRHFKNSKTPATLSIYPYLSKISQSILWPSPIKNHVPGTWWLDGMDADLVHARLHHVVEEHGPEVRVADPDPNWIRIKSCQWIQIPVFGIRIRIQEGKNDPQKVEKIRNFMFWSAGCFLLRAEGFFCNLDVLG